MSAKREKECRRAERACQAMLVSCRDERDHCQRYATFCSRTRDNCSDTERRSRERVEGAADLISAAVEEAMENAIWKAMKPYKLAVAIEAVTIVLLGLAQILHALGG